MIFAYLTLLSALLLAAIAGVFSVTGMMALFAGIPMAGLAVGIGIELGKLIAVSWLYRHWKDGVWFRHFMVVAALVSMVVTSIGVFGYLSKAHFEQGKDVSNNSAKIQVIDDKMSRYSASISRQRDNIKSYEKDIQKLDSQLDVIISHGNISGKENGSRAVLREQKPDRDVLNKDIKTAEASIDSSQEEITKLQEQKLDLGNSIRNFEVEVGPIKNVASVLYDDPEKNMDKAIRIVIFMIMIALDPMAIMLLMGFNHMVMKATGQTITTPPPQKLGKIKLIDRFKTTYSRVKDGIKNINVKRQRSGTGAAVDSLKKSCEVVTEEVIVPSTTRPTETPPDLVDQSSALIDGQQTVKMHTTTDVINGVTVSIPKHGTNHKSKMDIIKDKINSAPPDGWINNLTKRK